jgi:hypothetical protein
LGGEDTLLRNDDEDLVLTLVSSGEALLTSYDFSRWEVELKGYVMCCMYSNPVKIDDPKLELHVKRVHIKPEGAQIPLVKPRHI